MRFTYSTFRWLLALAVAGGVGLLASDVMAQANLPVGLGGPVAPTNAPGTAKLVPLTKKDGLTAFEEELSKSLEFLSPKSSLDGVLAPEYHPPPAPVVPNRQPRENQDRRAEWLLLNDGVKGGQTGEEWSQFPALEEDGKKRSSLEEIYQKFNRERSDGWSGLDSLGSRTRPGTGGQRRDDEETTVPGAIRQAESELKKQLGLNTRGGIFEPTPVRSSPSDFFGFSEGDLTSKQIQAHKDYLQQYQQVLDSFSTSPTASSPTPDAPAQLTPAPSYNLMESSTPIVRPTDAAPNARSLSSIVDPVRLPDLNANLLNQWNPLYEPPKVEPAKSAPIFSPSIEAPRRPF
jgi:hypothetical protein